MQQHHFPISVYPSATLRQAIGPDLDKIAGLALKTILKDRRSLEIAHQQFTWKKLAIAFSSRITSNGHLILELDIGDPRLKDRIILEHDFRKKPAATAYQRARSSPKNSSAINR